MGFRFSPSADGCQEVGRSVTTLACPLVAQWIQDHLLRSAQELLPWKKQTLRPHSGALSQKLYYNLDKQYCLQYPGSSNSPVALENTKKNLQRSSWPRMHGFAATHSKTHVRLRESCCAPPELSSPRPSTPSQQRRLHTAARKCVHASHGGSTHTGGGGEYEITLATKENPEKGQRLPFDETAKTQYPNIIFHRDDILDSQGPQT